jgi:hypothetical protein
MIICQFFLRILIILVTLLVKRSIVADFNGVLTSDVLQEWGLSTESKCLDFSSRGITTIETFKQFKN